MSNQRDFKDSDYFKNKCYLTQSQENGAFTRMKTTVVDFLQETADECDAFDSDVDEGPTIQTMFMANLTSEDPIYDEAGPSYDSNTPFEVQGHDTFEDHMDEYHEVHEMQSDVQHNYVVDSVADYTSDSNIIPSQPFPVLLSSMDQNKSVLKGHISLGKQSGTLINIRVESDITFKQLKEDMIHNECQIASQDESSTLTTLQLEPDSHCKKQPDCSSSRLHHSLRDCALVSS
ncbi:hypothetical protein Tco_1055527 [Tanacetum coccineum]|uniref:Uncharacterized protein n=1 Tax=Tanacetum coccineum TaxID=301880 RepID=A0ABQ5GZX1_9ASTR